VHSPQPISYLSNQMTRSAKILRPHRPPNGLYDLDDRRVLIRIAPSDGSKQVVVPKSLRSKVLYL
jgi:hypothetical protein